VSSRRRILYVQYTDPAGYPPLRHSSRILAEKGWNVLFLGSGADGSGDLRFEATPGIEVRMFGFCHSGWRQKLHHLSFCAWAFWAIFRWKPSWIYASDPFSCPVALGASWFFSLPVIYHEHDSPSPVPRGFWAHRISWARRRLAGRSRFSLLPNQQRAERFSEEMNRPKEVLCVWNCPPRKEVLGPRGQEWQEPLRLIFQGSWGPGRLPMSVLEAMVILKGRVHLTVVGYETVGHRGYAKLFRKKAQDLGVAAQLDWKESALAWREMLVCIRQADVGLSLVPVSTQDSNEKWMVGASNKPFEYLACGLALLVPDSAEWRQAYVNPGYGRACEAGDPRSIEKELLWFLEHPAEMRAMGERGRQRVLQEWNYETQFAPVLSRMEGGVK